MHTGIPLPLNRVNRIAISTYFFIAGLTFASWASRIPDIKTELQLTDAGLGTVLFALPVGLMFSLPLSGLMVGRFGSKIMLTIASIIYPLLLVLLGLINSTFQLVIVLFFFGFFANIFNIAVNTQAVSLEAKYGRSIMASFHGVWSVAGFSGALIATLVVNLHLNTLAHFCIICGLALGLGLAANRFTLLHDVGAKNQPIFVMPGKALLLLGAMAFCTMVCEGTMFDWSGVYFQKVVQAPKAYITVGYAAFMGAMAGGRFVGDKLAVRLGTKKTLQMSGVVIALGLLLAVALPYFATATIGFLLVGFGVSSVVPLVYSIAGRSATMSPGASLAAVSTIGFIGFLIGPPTIGFIAQAASLRWSFTLIALLGFCTSLLALRLKK